MSSLLPRYNALDSLDCPGFNPDNPKNPEGIQGSGLWLDRDAIGIVLAMALTGSSTRDDALAQFRANTGYDSDPTGEQAREFLAAARFLLSLPKRTKGPVNGETEIDTESIKALAAEARSFLASVVQSQTAATGSNMPRQFSRERWQ